MINANELRVGNYIQTEYGILTAHGSLISDISCGSIIATGIPLTPEILEKAGFTLFPWGWVKKASNGFGIRLNVQSFNYAVSGNSPVKIKHLHQLQNLYFALTGEELEINLT